MSRFKAQHALINASSLEKVTLCGKVSHRAKMSLRSKVLLCSKLTPKFSDPIPTFILLHKSKMLVKKQSILKLETNKGYSFITTHSVIF